MFLLFCRRKLWQRVSSSATARVARRTMCHDVCAPRRRLPNAVFAEKTSLLSSQHAVLLLSGSLNEDVFSSRGFTMTSFCRGIEYCSYCACREFKQSHQQTNHVLQMMLAKPSCNFLLLQYRKERVKSTQKKSPSHGARKNKTKNRFLIEQLTVLV